MARYRVNPGSVVTAVFGVAAVAAVGGLVWYLNQPTPVEAATPALREWVKQSRDGTEYRLAGPGQIVAQQGPLAYTFNLDSGHVFVTGGEVNQAFTLRNFENAAMVKAVKDTGCAIAASVTEKITAYKGSPTFGEEYRTFIDEHATIATAYTKNHCRP